MRLDPPCLPPYHRRSTVFSHTANSIMKIPPKSLYNPKTHSQPAENLHEIQGSKSSRREKEDHITVKQETESGKGEDEEEEGWPYNIENTLEKLDYQDRKWLLFQLVLTRPSFLDEVEMGFPMSLVPNDDNAHEGSKDGRGDVDVGVKRDNGGRRLSICEMVEIACSFGDGIGKDSKANFDEEESARLEEHLLTQKLVLLPILIPSSE